MEPTHQPRWPQIVLSVRLEEAELEISTWQEWIRSLPAEAKDIKIEGMYKSFSTLLLIRLPVALWNLLPNNLAYSLIGYVTSENLARLERSELGKSSVETTTPRDSSTKSRYNLRQAVPSMHEASKSTEVSSRKLTSSSSAEPSQGSLTARLSRRKGKGKATAGSACVVCRKAHQRCDMQRPCARCLSTYNEEAYVDTQSKRGFQPQFEYEPATLSRSPSFMDSWSTTAAFPLPPSPMLTKHGAERKQNSKSKPMRRQLTPPGHGDDTHSLSSFRAQLGSPVEATFPSSPSIPPNMGLPFKRADHPAESADSVNRKNITTKNFPVPPLETGNFQIPLELASVRQLPSWGTPPWSYEPNRTDLNIPGERVYPPSRTLPDKMEEDLDTLMEDAGSSSTDEDKSKKGMKRRKKGIRRRDRESPRPRDRGLDRSDPGGGDCWKSRLQLKGSNHKESYEGTQLGQIKYIVNCTEQTTEGIQAIYMELLVRRAMKRVPGPVSLRLPGTLQQRYRPRDHHVIHSISLWREINAAKLPF